MLEQPVHGSGGKLCISLWVHVVLSLPEGRLENKGWLWCEGSHDIKDMATVDGSQVLDLGADDFCTFRFKLWAIKQK